MEKTVKTTNAPDAHATNKTQETDLQRAIIDELRAIKDQQKAAYDEARSDQKTKLSDTKWTDVALVINERAGGPLTGWTKSQIVAKVVADRNRKCFRFLSSRDPTPSGI